MYAKAYTVHAEASMGCRGGWVRLWTLSEQPASDSRNGPRFHAARFGQALAAARTARRMTQQQLADASGVNRTYISALERGERSVGLENLMRLAGALGMSAGELIDSMPPARADDPCGNRQHGRCDRPE